MNENLKRLQVKLGVLVKRTRANLGRRTRYVAEIGHYLSPPMDTMAEVRADVAEAAEFVLRNTTHILDTEHGRWVLYPTTNGWAYRTPSKGGGYCLFGDRQMSAETALGCVRDHMKQWEPS